MILIGIHPWDLWVCKGIPITVSLFVCLIVSIPFRSRNPSNATPNDELWGSMMGDCASVAKFRHRRLRQRHPLLGGKALDSVWLGLPLRKNLWLELFPTQVSDCWTCHPLVVVCVCRPLLPLPFLRASSSASSAFLDPWFEGFPCLPGFIFKRAII